MNLSQQNNQQHQHHSERQKSVFDILYSDHQRRQVELQHKIHEVPPAPTKKRSSSISSAGPPRYVTLYEMAKDKGEKQRQLEIKINKEEGITFQPMTYRRLSRNSSMSRGETTVQYPEASQTMRKGKRGGMPPRPAIK